MPSVQTLLLLGLFSLASLAQITPTQSSDSYTCSIDQPCQLGCCGTHGYCGFGPSFCGLGNCTSSCDRKSECDPGWGAQWSNATTCPLKVCCSQYGFCGTTSDFCGNATVTPPACPSGGDSAKTRVVGYYESWSQQRCCDQMFPRGIPQGAWTHLNLAFAYIDPINYQITPMDERDVPLYFEFTNLKGSNPGLQTWISVGGWSMNDPGPYNGTFSSLANSTTYQDQFADSLMTFMDEYDFDGVDIDWEYPVAPERAGNPDDLQNYVSWMQNLKTALGDEYGLSITIPSSYWYMRNFNITALIDIVDWFNVMTYDLHGTWDADNPYVGPYVNSHTNLTEIDQTMDLLWRNSIDPSKVSMGLGFYGRSFTLASPSCDYQGCLFVAGGNPGPCTDNVGTLSFAEIEQIVANDNATVTLNVPAAVEEVVWDSNQWVSYDDAETFGMKYQWANGKCIGGLLVWAVSLDDANGTAQRDLCESLGCRVQVASDASGPISCGTTSDCQLYHTVINEDTCFAIYSAANMTFSQFRALNPELTANCSNLKLGYQYCVAGSPAASNSTASCSISSSSVPSSTSLMSSSPVLSSSSLQSISPSSSGAQSTSRLFNNTSSLSGTFSRNSTSSSSSSGAFTSSGSVCVVKTRTVGLTARGEL